MVQQCAPAVQISLDDADDVATTLNEALGFAGEDQVHDKSRIVRPRLTNTETKQLEAVSRLSRLNFDRLLTT